MLMILFTENWHMSSSYQSSVDTNRFLNLFLLHMKLQYSIKGLMVCLYTRIAVVSLINLQILLNIYNFWLHLEITLSKCLSNVRFETYSTPRL